MCAKSNIAIFHAIIPEIGPHHPVFRQAVTKQLTHASLISKDKKKTTISLKIFKTFFFKIYNPTFTKFHIPNKMLFSKITPTTNLNTALKHLSHVLPYSHLKKNCHNQPHKTFKILFYTINQSIILFDIHTDIN